MYIKLMKTEGPRCFKDESLGPACAVGCVALPDATSGRADRVRRWRQLLEVGYAGVGDPARRPCPAADPQGLDPDCGAGSDLSDRTVPVCSSAVTGTAPAVKTASLRLPRRSAKRLSMPRAKACLTAQVRPLLLLEDSAQEGRCVFGNQAVALA